MTIPAVVSAMTTSRILLGELPNNDMKLPQLRVVLKGFQVF
jgi:hypothetical protein